VERTLPGVGNALGFGICWSLRSAFCCVYQSEQNYRGHGQPSGQTQQKLPGRIQLAYRTVCHETGVLLEIDP